MKNSQKKIYNFSKLSEKKVQNISLLTLKYDIIIYYTIFFVMNLPPKTKKKILCEFHDFFTIFRNFKEFSEILFIQSIHCDPLMFYSKLF